MKLLLLPSMILWPHSQLISQNDCKHGTATRLCHQIVSKKLLYIFLKGNMHTIWTRELTNSKSYILNYLLYCCYFLSDAYFFQTKASLHYIHEISSTDFAFCPIMFLVSKAHQSDCIPGKSLKSCVGVGVHLCRCLFRWWGACVCVPRKKVKINLNLYRGTRFPTLVCN